MNEKIIKHLDYEAESRIPELGGFELGSEEYSEAVEDLEKIIKTNVDACRFAEEIELRNRELDVKEMELENKRREAEIHKHDKEMEFVAKLVESGVKLTAVYWGLSVCSSMFRTSIIFEQDGIVTTTAGKKAMGFITSLLPLPKVF